MAEEFQQLPESLQKMSSTLVHNRKSRTAFICGVIILMAFASSAMLISETNEYEPSGSSTESTTQLSSTLHRTDIKISDVDSSKNNKRSSGDDFLVPQQQINMNLYLTAVIHHNITVNEPKMFNINEQNCNRTCMKNFVNMVGFEEVIKSMSNFKINSSISIQEDTTNIVKSDGITNDSNKTSMDDYEDLNGTSQNIETRCSYSTETNQKTNCDVVRIKRNVLGSVNFSFANILDSKRLDVSNNNVQVVDASTYEVSNNSYVEPENVKVCDHPEYIVFTWVLCLIALATALKLYYLIKTFLAIIMVAVYTILILVFFENVFLEKGNTDE